MRTDEEIEEYNIRTRTAMLDGDLTQEEQKLQVQMFAACIPDSFWKVTPEQVVGNRWLFDNCIVPYSNQLRKAWRNGYGLICVGDNGVGKTMFLCYILKVALQKGYSAYYTTASELDNQLKWAMDDPSRKSGIEVVVMQDFLVLDELAKEQYKAGDSWIRTQIERVIKGRYDAGLPTLIGSNANCHQLGKAYGASLASLFHGNFKQVIFDPGDHRKKQREKLDKDLFGI